METENESAPVWYWIGLIAISSASFWVQATVTEERFVPALNVIAKHFNIPDDVAGATLMAAGASSPELFSAIVALFITHSSLGIGTIVGSEVFNQLCICAGSVLEARSGQLVLDKPIVIRECLFYAISIGLLYYSLSDRRPLDSDPSGPKHMFVSWFVAALMVGTYILYVIVLANFDAILVKLGVSGAEEKTAETQNKTSYGAIAGSNAKGKSHVVFVREANFAREPSENFAGGFDEVENGFGSSFRSSLRSSMRNGVRKMAEGLHIFDTERDHGSIRAYQVEETKPSNLYDLDDIVHDDEESSMSCFMWQRSQFYDNAMHAMNAWHLRWFTITKMGIESIADRKNADKKPRKYPRFDSIEVDKSANLITVSHSENVGCEYQLMAPTADILDEVIVKCDSLLEYWETHETEEKIEHVPDEEEESLIAYPHGASKLSLAVHFVLFPLKALIQFTIPDVRGINLDPINKAWMATLMCLIWLIVGSYFMVSSLENLADLMDIPDAIVGVTVSAAGTSLPNYVASQVAARQGLGNMAVSNAFGSNVFNILIGLGLPWLLYTVFVTKGDDYTDLIDDGTIVENVIILVAVLLVFVVLMLFTGFVLHRWHATVFLGLYVTYVIYEVAQNYL